MVSAARESGAAYVEPTPEAEQAWCDTIAEVATDNSAFLAECTPGYYNGEGTRRSKPSSYSPGPVAFHRELANWRNTHMSDVLVQPAVQSERTAS